MRWSRYLLLQTLGGDIYHSTGEMVFVAGLPKVQVNSTFSPSAAVLSFGGITSPSSEESKDVNRY
jgi:hypothetical protein